MTRINFEAYVIYLGTFCGVKNARSLASEIFAENYPCQKIDFTPRRKTTEIEDCLYDQSADCWIPSGRIEKIAW